MYKYFMIFLVIFSLLSCMSAPKTREEFIEIIKKSGGSYRVETYEINRSFEDIVANLKLKADKCLNREIEQTIHGQYGIETSYEVYLATVTIIDPDKAEFTYVFKGYPKPVNVPEEGIYLSAADIHRVSESETKVIIYGSSVLWYNEIFEAVKSWCEGTDAPCPSLP